MLIQVSIEDLIKVPLIFNYDSDEDCKIVLYSSNATGFLQFYTLPTDLSSKPKQITSGRDPILGGNLSPRGDKLVFLRDKDGNEISNLFLLSTEGGEPKQITNTPYRTLGLAWHPNGKEITRSFVSMKGCGLETINLETEECFMLKAPTPPLMVGNYSHDGKWLACTEMKSLTNTQILILNRDDPNEVIKYNISDDSREGIPSWAPNDKKIAFGSEATGRARVIIQEFQGEEKILLNLEEDEEAAIIGGPAKWNPQSNIVYYVVSKHSRTTLHAHPIDGEKETALPFPEGTVAIPKISKDGKILIALHSSMTSPFGIYLHEIGSDSVCPLTPRDFNFDLSLLTRPQSIWYKSFDGLDIHGWYVPAATGKSPHPAIIHPHGGPWGQVFDDWNFGMFEQMVSQNGFAIFAPNFRGSTGYGSEFQNLDIGDPGGGDLEDIIYGTEWLGKQQDVDENKIAITGGSYGGYLTLLALTKKPDRFVTGIARVPVVNWVETYRLSDPFFKQYERTLFGGPPRKKIKELYIDRSPSTYISNIKAPVMIMAGKEDSRCPIEPIEKFIEKLKEMNHPHEFLLIEKAGHISAMFNWEISIPLLTKTMDFFKKNLK